jgi:hypothetical protein
VQSRAARASAAMAFAGRAKIRDDASIVIQKFVRRWLAKRRLRELLFEVRFRAQQEMRAWDHAGCPQAVTAEGAYTENAFLHNLNDPTASKSAKTPRTKSRMKSRPSKAEIYARLASRTEHDSMRPPLVALEMQRKAERRDNLRRASQQQRASRHASLAAPLTKQQSLKVRQREFPYSRVHAAAGAGIPQNAHTEHCQHSTMEQLQKQLPALGDVGRFQAAIAPAELQRLDSQHTLVDLGGAPELRAMAAAPRQNCSTGTAEEHLTQVQQSEELYSQCQRALTPVRTCEASLLGPSIKVEVAKAPEEDFADCGPEDAARIAHIMTQTQKGAALASVDSCFQMLLGRYQQFWALPNALQVDERDWAYRHELNKVQPPEAEIDRPLKGRIIRTGADLGPVIDELNRSLTPSLEEFRARTAPVEHLFMRALHDIAARNAGAQSEAGHPATAHIVHTEQPSSDQHSCLSGSEHTQEHESEQHTAEQVPFSAKDCLAETATHEVCAQQSWESGRHAFQENLQSAPPRPDTTNHSTAQSWQLTHDSSANMTGERTGESDMGEPQQEHSQTHVAISAATTHVHAVEHDEGGKKIATLLSMPSKGSQAGKHRLCVHDFC